ncbi:MAG TPA: UbiA family prenyltransferase [Myxococcota bacterium]|nr:UbiA family prenyltransferase [Myxococcota bacterium]
MIRPGGVLRLLRPPNVFTAFADALAGVLVVRAAGGAAAAGTLASLGVMPAGGLPAAAEARGFAVVAASGAMYLAGIVLNDLFDRDVDARERPGRPIPSGDVPVWLAAALGAALLVGGVALAAWVSPASGAVAGALAAMVLAYDGGLKRRSTGPLVMGACRTLNFALGLSTGVVPLGVAGGGVGATPDEGLAAVARGFAALPAAVWLGPLLLGLYVATLTYLARDEVPGNTAARARRGMVALVALATWLGLSLIMRAIMGVMAPHEAPDAGAGGAHIPAPAMVLFVATVWLGGRVWGPLWKSPDGATTRRAIGGGILLIPLIDATMVAAAGAPEAALGVAALALPALLLRRWFSPT